MSHNQQRPIHMVGGGNYHHNQHNQFMNDTTYTKIFVGGLAWETQRDTMRKYFEQFGEILEAVVITDKSTGRSKGYGFVTFKDPESAFRACQNPSPVIDGRRANCNLASIGAQKNRPPTPQHVGGGGRFRASSPSPGLMNAPTAAYSTTGSSSSSPYFPQPPPFPYSPYGFTGYAHDTMYHMNYYGGYGQQFSPYYPTTGATASGSIGYFHNFYPYYGPYAQTSQAHGFGVQYPPQLLQQYPFLPQQQQPNSSGILSLPTSTLTSPASTSTTTTSTTTATTGVTTTIVLAPSTSAGSGPSQVSTTRATSEQQNSST